MEQEEVEKLILDKLEHCKLKSYETGYSEESIFGMYELVNWLYKNGYKVFKVNGF